MSNNYDEKKGRSLSESELFRAIERMTTKEAEKDCPLLKELVGRDREKERLPVNPLRGECALKQDYYKRVAERKMLLDALEASADHNGIATLKDMAKLLQYNPETVRRKLQKHADIFWTGNGIAMNLRKLEKGVSESDER